ncbi:MAG: 2Fe-2S iron-sulfur cluster binding domain-containing protein, partial [Erysipelotrichaceae bacterium]|nr:2Fe-2S iron-sulfur cluster binding domain-containing protein [Erysipelotrichaceae bacterium]
GQFVTLGKRVGTSYLSRPYSLVSSPKEALEGKYEIIVQKKGIFSSHLVDDAPINSEVEVLEPSGDFCYDDLRDRKHILAIAGGSGVTPFISMMKAIREGSEEYRLTLLYGVRTLKDLFFDPKDYEDDKIKIVIVLSDEEAEAYRHGFIDKELILENMDEETDIFMCGPDALYRHVEKQLEGLDKEIRIRKERNSIGDRKVDEEKIYKLIVHMRDEVFEIEAKNNETLVAAMERAGIKAPVKCKTGVCGFCHSRVIKGNYTIEEGNDFRRAADKIFNCIHPCCTYPESDMEIDVPYTKEEG